MGCGDATGDNYAKSEFDCMLQYYSGGNHEKGNQAFENHWKTWITADTVQSVHDVGLNTIRIPIGYWSYDNIVYTDSEPFADGSRMLPYLDAVVQKAADLGIYVIIDLHGAPGGQQQDAFTGQNPSVAGFFNDNNYKRAEDWVYWMAKRIHQNSAYRTVGMIEVLNEPVSQHDGSRWPAPGEDPGLVQTYYPGALGAIRQAETDVGITDDSKKLHVQFMSDKWLAGNPRANSYVAGDSLTAFDDHNYIGFDGFDTSNQYNLMHSACTDSRLVSGETFRITGEWSLTSNVNDWQNQKEFYTKWFTAQQQLYEEPGMDGWVFWTWKTELNDPRWTYSYATYLGWAPTNAAELQNNVYQDVCSGYR